MVGDRNLDHLSTAPRAQPLLDDLSFLDFVGQQHLWRHGGGFRIELLDKLADHFIIGCIFRAFQDEILAPDQFAAADEKDLHTGFAV